MITFPSRAQFAADLHAHLEARERAFRRHEAEQTYRRTCFALLRACFNEGSETQIRWAAHMMELARHEMETRG